MVASDGNVAPKSDGDGDLDKFDVGAFSLLGSDSDGVLVVSCGLLIPKSVLVAGAFSCGLLVPKSELVVEGISVGFVAPNKGLPVEDPTPEVGAKLNGVPLVVEAAVVSASFGFAGASSGLGAPKRVVVEGVRVSGSLGLAGVPNNVLVVPLAVKAGVDPKSAGALAAVGVVGNVVEVASSGLLTCPNTEPVAEVKLGDSGGLLVVLNILPLGAVDVKVNGLPADDGA